MTPEQWLASSSPAWLVPLVIVLGLVATLLRERDVPAEGTADSGLGQLEVNENGEPVRWAAGLALGRRVTVSLLAVCVAVLMIAAVVRFATLT